MTTDDQAVSPEQPGRRGWVMNPVARKRWRRFRNHRRGFWSLCLLVGLYLISLFSEVLCNDRPLAVRFQGSWYFPVLRFYPEDAFAANGRMTRPDYKALNRLPAFADGSGNFMVFPPIPYGPNEIIDPTTLRGEERVELNVRHMPRVGSVQVDADGRIMRSQAASAFIGDLSAGAELAEAWPLPAELLEAIRRRMANEAAGSTRYVLTNRTEAAMVAELSLTSYTPRREPPRDVRITFREQLPEKDRPRKVTFTRALDVDEVTGVWWSELADEEQERLRAIAGRAFDGLLTSRTESLGGKEYAVEVKRNDVQWPFRPNSRHWLGIDNAGRDVFARILYGLRTSMTFGLLLVVFSMGFGTLMGAVQGYYGGRIDLVSQRIIEIWSTIPFLYVMIWLGSLYGRSFVLLLVCYGIFNWIGISAYVRAEFLRLRGMPFVDAARCLGLSGPRIMSRHILPNALTPIITFFPFSLVGAIGSLAMLDYLGFGLPPPTPSWGELLQQAQSFRWAWWLILYPSLALFMVMLMGVFIGEGVRDAYDPKPLTRME